MEPDLPDYESAVIGAMKAMSRDLSLRDLQVLELIYCSGWSGEQVATALQISRPLVSTIKSRHNKRLEREIRRRIAEDS
jgi:DNA-directed RNA polymerase specialized sigma subunit